MGFKDFISRVIFKIASFRQRSEKQFYISVLILVLICLIVISIVFYRQKAQENDRDSILEKVKIIEEQYDNSGAHENYGNESFSGAEEIIRIKVYVCGEVNNPGVYEADSKTRTEDLIEMAGGASANACLEALNLAEEAFDGQKIYVPSIDEVSSGTAFQESSNSNSESQISNIKIININFARKSDLELLPGIGPELAQRIIDHRNEKGLFGRKEDIKNVKGIGDKKYEIIKDKITV